MRILFLDIETAPHTGYFWKLWKENIGVSQLIKPGYTISWAARWKGEKKIQFDSVRHSKPEAVYKGIWKLLDEADVVVHFYGKRFDIPTLNKEFIKLGMKPPSPYKQVDLKEVAAKVFFFASNKLEFVAKFLGVGCKIKTDFDLWADCLNGDEKAWDKMEKYNKWDTVLLERVYNKMLPWIPSHPNWSAFHEDIVCPQCGSEHFHKRGKYVADMNVYQRYHCLDCGKYFRGNKSINKKQSIKFKAVS